MTDLGSEANELEVPSYEGQRWYGRWPLRSGTRYPEAGIPIVYFLYEDGPRPIYIGSTGNFISRMEVHLRDKTWTRWKAWRCRSRPDAYRLEAIEIRDHRPRLNKALKRPTEYTGCDITPDLKWVKSKVGGFGGHERTMATAMLGRGCNRMRVVQAVLAQRGRSKIGESMPKRNASFAAPDTTETAERQERS